VSTIATLMRGSVDYAGMFPPAGLPFGRALDAYARYLAHPHAWMLGSLVMSSSVLAQVDAAAEGLARVPRLSIVLAGDFDTHLDVALTHAAAGRRHGRTTSIEVPPVPPAEITSVATKLPGDVEAFFETPADELLDARLDAIGVCGALAKLRAGGVSADAFPAPRQVYRFLRGCADRRICCKATAGLHHAITGEYPLTYEAGSSRTRMYGFLNLCAAAGLAWAAAGEAAVTAALQDAAPASFQFDADGWRWATHRWSVHETAAIRQDLFGSFGSCSFDEPVGELTKLGLIEERR